MKKEDELTGMISTIKHQRKADGTIRAKADSFEQFEERLDQSPFFEAIDDL